MSKYTDMLFWVVMTLIIVVIGFLSYVTFFYQPLPIQPKMENSGLAQEEPEPPKVQTLYVCDDEAKIRSLPRNTGKIVRSAKKGEQVAIIREKDDWFGIKTKAGKPGWIEKKYVCDHPPKPVEETKKEKEKPPKPAPKKQASPKNIAPPPAMGTNVPPFNQPSPEDYPPPVAGSIENLIDGLISRINSRSQTQFGQPLLSEYNLIDGGMRLEVKVGSSWSLLPQNYKAQVLQILYNQYSLIACNIAKIVNCTQDNAPSLSIVDSSGREVAYQNSGGSQVLE